MSAAREQTDGAKKEMTALGGLGLLPFAASALAVWFAPDLAAQAAVFGAIYGAVIAAYLAGANAGASLAVAPGAARQNFTAGQVLLLIALFAALPDGVLFDAPAGARHGVVALVLVLLFLRDRAAAKAGLVPDWFFRLRIILTAGAVASLLAIALAGALRGGF